MTKSSRRREVRKRSAQSSNESFDLDFLRNTPLNFKVSAEFRREFKTFAAQHNKKLYELLYESFAALKSKHAE